MFKGYVNFTWQRTLSQIYRAWVNMISTIDVGYSKEQTN